MMHFHCYFSCSRRCNVGVLSLLFHSAVAAIVMLWCIIIVISAVAANAATLLMQSSSTTNGGQPPAKKLFPAPSTLDFAEIASNAAAAGDLSFPRRERFVFRPSHLEILEKYFQDNNYPSYETREEIALACNTLSETAGKLYL